MPATAVRQAVRVFSGSVQNSAPFFAPHYDLLTLTLSFDFGANLEPKVLYQIELLDGMRSGVRLAAFDRAPLADDDLRARWSFVTSARSDPAVEPRAPKREPTCEEIGARLASSCSSAACHGGATPAMGLSFEKLEDLQRTAIDRVAHETETGDQIGVSFENPSRFGVAMPIIAPGAAHESYLVYKLLLAPENLLPCAGAECAFADLPGSNDCRALSPDERRRVAEWFVPGQPMPPARSFAETEILPPAHYLDCAFMRALTRWINAGARCE